MHVDLEERREYMKGYRERNRAALAARRRHLYATDEDIRRSRLVYRQSTDKKRAGHLRRRYGITPEAYEALLSSQGGRCAICRTDDPGGRHGRYFAVDHSHADGSVRGLLCATCNQGIGLLKENPEVLAAAIEYLGRTS